MTNIEWTDCTWNPVIGCQHVAQGCKHCYAETMSKRLAAMGQDDYAQILDARGKFNGRAITRPDKLAEPLRWRKPRMVFVNSMSDLFHKDVPFEFIAAVYGVMAACPHHTFQILTKRPERMLEFMQWAQDGSRVADAMRAMQRTIDAEPVASRRADMNKAGRTWNLYAGAENLDAGNDKSSWPLWPLKNVWHGTSIAEQKDADKNIPILLQVPSATRFVSAEPLIGDVWLGRYLGMPGLRSGHQFGRCANCGKEPGVRPDTRTNDEGEWLCSEACGDQDEELGCALEHKPLDWVIVGGESGPGARPCGVAWIRSIVQQCKAADVACFNKQLGARPFDPVDGAECDCPQWTEHCEAEAHPRGYLNLADRKGGDPSEWPEDLRVRQFPEANHA